jgi:hypothetical protein
MFGCLGSKGILPADWAELNGEVMSMDLTAPSTRRGQPVPQRDRPLAMLVMLRFIIPNMVFSAAAMRLSVSTSLPGKSLDVVTAPSPQPLLFDGSFVGAVNAAALLAVPAKALHHQMTYGKSLCRVDHRRTLHEEKLKHIRWLPVPEKEDTR